MDKRNKVYKNGIKYLQIAIDTDKSHSYISVQEGNGKNYVSSLENNLEDEYANNRISEDVYNEFKSTFKIYKEKGSRGSKKTSNNINKHKGVDDSSVSDSYDALSKAGPIRGDIIITDTNTGYEIQKINEYYYDIKIRDKQSLTGFFTRDEMELVYKLYSNLDGAGLTQRAVGRYFPSLTFRDFKRILKAFSITKSSTPLAPHQIEEMSVDNIAEVIFKNKENLALKRLENERNRVTEVQLKNTRKELIDAKKQLTNIQELMVNVNLSEVKPFVIEKTDIDEEISLVLYLSDMHIGAYNSKRKTLYDDNVFNKEAVIKRLNQIIKQIRKEVDTYGVFDKIIVVNLGDALDGYDSKTTRGGHILPQNMDNETQFMVFIDTIRSFIDTIYTNKLCNNVEYYSVNGGNHDGSFGWVANKSLEMYFNVKYPDMVVEVFNKFIDTMEYGVHTFVLTHGKDDTDKKFGFPMYLNDKTENYFNEFLDNHSIYKDNIHVISGDLHQATSFWGKRFRYKKVASLFGSSKWIQHNFGNTKAATNYDIVHKNNATILEGIVWHNKFTEKDN